MKTAIVALCASLSLAACATVTRGTNDVLEIQSNPSGATAKLSTGHVCETPCAIKLPRRSEVEVAFSAPGYKPAKARVTNKVAQGGALGMAGNVVVGGVIGAGVDVASGAMLDLTPNPLVITLQPAQPVAPGVAVPRAFVGAAS